MAVDRESGKGNNAFKLQPGVQEPRRIWSLVRLCAVLVAGIGLVALLGWALKLPVLASLGAGMIPVAPSTAVMFVLYAAAVFLSTRLPMSRAAYWTGLFITATGALAAALLFILSLQGIQPDVEHLGFAIVNRPGETPVGHMSPITALCFLLSSLSYLLSLSSSRGSSWRASTAWLLACLVIAISLLLILAYLYGTPFFYDSSFIPPAALTSMAFMALGISLLALAAPHAWPSRRQAESATRASYTFVLVFVLLAAGIVVAGFLYYRNYEMRHRKEVERQLSAIAHLKVDELVQWRKERLGDAAVLYKNINFSGLVRRYLEVPEDSEAQERLLTWLGHVREGYYYDRVFLLDARGRERMSVPKARRPISRHVSLRAVEVLRTKQMVLEDFYRNEFDQRVYLAVLVPIFEARGAGRALGTLVLRIDPEQYLYPFLKRWPTPSRTAETLIVRRERSDVLFLNELRFQENTALNLRFPIERKEMPAVQAALGRKGVIEGRDYRGVPVIADMRPVPDSPWFLVARMDISEVYEPMREKLWMMVALVGALLMGAGGGVGMVWRRQRTQFYQENYKTSGALRESQEQLRLLIEGVTDYAIIMLDPAGNVMSWNQGAERIKGYREEEIIGRHFSCFYTEEDVQQDKPQQELERAAADGRFEDEGWRIRKDGSRFWGNAILTALRDDTGGLRGFSKITRDITEQKRAQQERDTTIAFLRLVNDTAGTRDLVQAAATFFQQQSGCEAVGIRLHEGEDYPYYEARGFSKEFVLMENSLCAKDSAGCVIRDSAGYPVIECMCGNVICGRYNPDKPFFTKHGSFWTNNTTELLRSTTEADRQARTRNRCNGEGYESVALLPLRLGEQRLGLLQLNDRRIGVFSAEAIASWERLADHLAVALAKFRTEEELRKSEQRYRSLFDNMIEGFAHCRMLYEGDYPKDFIYLDVNSAFEKLTGLKNVVGKKVTEVIPGIRESDPGLFEIYGRVAKTGKPERFEIYVEALQMWFSISVYSPKREYFVAVFDVITERKMAEKALRESEAKFRDLYQEFHGLLDAIPDSIMLLDKDLKVLWANKAVAGSVGETPEVLAGRFCYDLWHKRTTPCEGCPVVHSFESGKPCNETLTSVDGRVWDIRTVPLIDERGSIARVIEVKRDITEHRKLEAQYLQAQKMESIGTLAGGVAHDFNNILSAIIGYGHVALMKMTEDDPLRLHIENMLEGADRAAHLTKDLLLFSRKQVSERKPVDMNKVIGQVEKFLKRVIGEDIICKKTVTEHPLTVFADSHQLEQVLMNLATNARDAMPRGGAFTVLTEDVNLNEDFTGAHGYGKPGAYAMITVSDTGKGMDEETRKRIFEPFFTTKEVGKGTGLGLAVVYGIIKQHDGFINVYSEPGKGTTFRIYLPLIAPETTEETAASQEEAPVRGTETVLVAEDDEALRKLSRTVLTEYGYTVIEAVDGEEAVKKFVENKDRIQLLLFDLIMPKMNGKEAYDEIRKIKPDMKVIFASGYAPDLVRQKASLENGAHLVFKPISPMQLLRKVRSVLDENTK